MASMMQCPHEGCGRPFIVPWEKKGELMKCPFCLQSVFADQIGLVHIEEGISKENLPPIIQSYKTSKLELLCVGNSGSGYIKAQVHVEWFNPIPDAVNRKLLLDGKCLPIRNHFRKERVNYCWFEIPDGYLCWYCRRAQIKPNVEERRCFCMSDGQFIDLGEAMTGLTMDLITSFYPQYSNWNITVSS